jgi:signal transduction histidine kinase
MKLLIQSIAKYSLYKVNNPSNEEKLKVISFIQVWVSTTIIMWCYVAFSLSIFKDNTVGLLGLLYTIIHTLTPMFYRYTNSLTLAGLIISLTALCFQITFCIYNGGIYSPSAIWFTAHPVIISFFASRKLIGISVLLNIVVVISLTLLGNQGLFPLDTLSDSLTQTMMISSLIGLDIIIATYTLVFINKTQVNEKELLRRNVMIENLMRIISHDLNNVLTTSMLASASLAKEVSTESAIRKLALIDRSNKQINDMTNSVRDWIIANDNTVPLSEEKIIFEEIIDFVETNFEMLLSEKKIKLIINNTISKDQDIYLDDRALRYQIISNLINNAIKFSPLGSEIVFTSLIENNKLLIAVKDQGLGIPKSILMNIFDPSSGNSRRGTAGEKGTGFGLPIVKTIVELFKGEIRIDSIVKTQQTQDYGTTVTVTLPLI